LALLGNAYELYRRASPTIRRQLNQAMCGPFRVYERDVRADLALPFAVLVAPKLMPEDDAVAEHDDTEADEQDITDENHTKTNRALLLGRGLNELLLVAPMGFEPTLPP
jgi:hypothetical protein